MLASCTATSIIDNNSVIDVIKPPAIAENTDRALSTVVSSQLGSTLSFSVLSNRRTAWTSTIAATT